jgi:Methylase involved in ubiquinone/menaquinone biosynthesis
VRVSHFDDNSFDVISIPWSLSYGRSELVDKEIYRILRPNGYFICVDSLNFNPIYRINRYINYLRGQRSLMTLKNMPTVKRVLAYSNIYRQVSLKYFGCISFISPLISIIFNEHKTKRISDKYDSLFANPYCAFKFVLLAKK